MGSCGWLQHVDSSILYHTRGGFAQSIYPLAIFTFIAFAIDAGSAGVVPDTVPLAKDFKCAACKQDPHQRTRSDTRGSDRSDQSHAPDRWHTFLSSSMRGSCTNLKMIRLKLDIACRPILGRCENKDVSNLILPLGIFTYITLTRSNE